MNRLLILLLCVALTFGSLKGEEPVQAPMNPDYMEYLNEVSTGHWQTVTESGKSLGYIPPPYLVGQPARITSPKKDKLQWDPPVSWDMRDTTWLTSVKDQGTCGDCWGFATLGSIESRWKALGYGTYDLSEQNVKNCHGFIWGACDGGNAEMSSAYLSRQSGPILETSDPYDVNNGTCNSTYNPQSFITDAEYLPTRSVTDYQTELKFQVYTYGAVYTVMRWEDASYNSTTKTYYYSGNSASNHAVTLVGWDDNKVVPGAPGNGAWIIKNSWGSGWGENGYFYISYYDTKVHLETAIWPNRSDYNSDGILHYYDKFGGVSSTGYGNSTAYGLIKFVPTGNRVIKQISTWMAAPGTVSFYIYDTYSGGTLSSLLGSLTSQTVEFAGYKTFTLPTPIPVSNGNDFYIKVYYNTTGYNYPLPIETSIAGYCSVTLQTGKCWMSSGGTSWTAVGSGTSHLYNLCIRAYTESQTPPDTTKLLSPANGAVNVALSPTFKWNTAQFAVTYTLQVSTNTAFSTNIINQANITDTTYAATNLTGGTQYYWRVRATNQYGSGAWSDIRNFTTLTPLLPPVLVSPADGLIPVVRNPLFTWNTVTGATSYQLQASTVSTFGSLWLNTTSITNTSYQCPVNLPLNTLFYWRVMPVNTLGGGSWSNVWSFTTTNGALAVPASWNFANNTGSSASITLPAAANPVIGTRNFMPGDAIGVFFDNGGSLVCGGYGVWMNNDLQITAWGDNPGTTLKDGFLIGDSYKYKVWDAQAGIEYFAAAGYSSGQSTFQINGQSVLSGICLTPSTTQNLSMNNGWNLVSSYVMPSMQAVADIVAPIIANIEIMKNGMGEMYVPAWNINYIGNWNYNYNYWIYLTSAVSLNIDGLLAAPQYNPIGLQQGWNNVSYLRNTQLAAATALSSVSGNLVLAKNGAGQIYYPLYNINLIGNMLPGQGYSLYVSAAANLIYPVNTLNRAFSGESGIIPEPKYLKPEFTNTGNNSSLIISFGSEFDGNEIGIYTENGMLVGSGIVSNGNAAIAINGDNLMTTETDGAIAGENLKTAVYNPTTRELKDIQLNNIKELTGNETFGQLKYIQDNIMTAECSIVTDVSDITNSNDLIIKPNPVNSEATIQFYTDNADNADIIIYNLQGIRVYELQSGNMTAGLHEITIDLSTLTIGTYILQVGNANYSHRKMIQVVR